MAGLSALEGAKRILRGSGSVSLVFEERQECAERVSEFEQHVPADGRDGLGAALWGGRSGSEEIIIVPGSVFGMAIPCGAIVVAMLLIFDERNSFGQVHGRSALFAQETPRAGDREALVIEQTLYAQHGLNVLSPVEALAFGAFHGLESGEFGLPVA